MNRPYLMDDSFRKLARSLSARSDWQCEAARAELAELLPRLPQTIDHTLLKPEATASDVRKHCEQAQRYPFAVVCLFPVWLDVAREVLADTVPLCSVIGFPSGCIPAALKAREAEYAVAHGAIELDMVWHIGAALANDWRAIRADVRAVVQAAGDAFVKVILETAALPDDIIAAGALVCVEAGAAFVKTSTGFHPAGGASEDAVGKLRAAVGDRAGVKAAGGIRDLRTALRMIAAGADRIGTSSGISILQAL